ncbi:MAG: glycosyltransferase family 4 protein [Chloroflexi bacterium]|nr:glycosyltransferase family 4 protein [Chloroflexota bacterium]MDA1145286.1 glycosyltransferase family 4 protein [Chloroflexota bacterium]
MRIRYWSGQFDLDDLDDVAARLAPALAARGHTVTLVAPRSDRPADAIVSERLSIHRVDATVGTDATALPAPVAESPDIDLVETGGPLSALALEVARRDGRPLAVSIHGPLANNTHEDGNIEGALLQYAAAIVVDTETLAGQLRAVARDSAARTTVVRAGLPLTELAPGPRLLKRPTLLCVGPLTRDSGFDVAIDALAEIRERIRTAELVIVGDGPERDALQAQAAALGLGQAVSFRGNVATSRLPAIVNQVSLVVVPARVPVSSCAIAILGGQLLRPVIASAIGGLTEVIEQEGNGLLVVPEDPAAIAGAARRLLSEPGAAADLGRRGRTLARERFGWNRFVDEMERLLDTTLARANARPNQGMAG